MIALKTLGELLEKLKIDRFAQTYQLVMHIIQKVWFFSHFNLLRFNINLRFDFFYNIYRVQKIQMLIISHRI